MRVSLMAVLGLSLIAMSPLAMPGAARAQKPAAGADRQAPVGHRQPRAQDSPTDRSADAVKAQDRALDKALKSICRGC